MKKATTVASHLRKRGKSPEPKRIHSVRSSSKAKDVKKSTQDIKGKKNPIKQHVTETPRRSSSPAKPASHALTNQATKGPATKGPATKSHVTKGPTTKSHATKCPAVTTPATTRHATKPREPSSLSKRAASLACRTTTKPSSRHTIAVKLRTSSRSSKRVE